MSLISAKNISVAVKGRAVLHELSFSIEEGARLALVGANGCGKSTLLRILAGIGEPDAGIVARRRELRAALVEQFLPGELRGLSVREAVALSEGHRGRPPEQDYLVDCTLSQLGFQAETATQSVESLSGGEVNRLLMARALVGDPHLLLLDEPTNHMDIAAIEEFEEMLTNSVDCALCIVSHDRALLDHLTRETFILREGELLHYRLNYSQATEALRLTDEALLCRVKDEEREIDRLRTSAARLKDWAHTFGNEKFAYRAASIEKRIAKREAALPELPTARSAALRLETERLVADFLLKWECGSVALGPNLPPLLFDRLVASSGERVAIVGPNGTGKSSLLKTIVAAFHSRTATISFNPRLKLGYYDQVLELANRAATVLEVARKCTEISDGALVRELIAAGFPYARQQQAVGTLSGGERARLKLLCIKLEAPNFLLLDEPTNHIDVEGIQALECELLKSEAGCLFVSHDRRFVANVATRVLTIRAGRVEEVVV